MSSWHDMGIADGTAGSVDIVMCLAVRVEMILNWNQGDR